MRNLGFCLASAAIMTVAGGGDTMLSLPFEQWHAFRRARVYAVSYYTGALTSPQWRDAAVARCLAMVEVRS